jgi:DNA (cytosine-5)-methyltransferase 1
MNYDQYIIDKRSAKYPAERKRLFLDTFRKLKGDIHIKLSTLEDMYDDGSLPCLYQICQTITQTLRSRCGLEFEDLIAEIFYREGIAYYRHVVIEGRKVDFMVGNILISTKTTLRERCWQDHGLNAILVTLDKCSPSKMQGEICIVDATELNFTCLVQRLKQMTTPPKVLDLFCGAGGFSQGFRDAGMNVICGIDHWPIAVETYQHNCGAGELALCKDLTTYTPSQLEEEHKITNVDVVIGGPPCQGFSIAGRRDESDSRNQLFRNYVAYVAHYKPKIFVMENVMGILSMRTKDGHQVKDLILAEFPDYRVKIFKLYASDYEVPQRRRRVFFFGIRRDFGVEPPDLTETFPEIPVTSVLDSTYDDSLILTDRALEGIACRKLRMKEEGKGFGAQILDLNKPSYTISARIWKDGYDALVPLEEGGLRRLSVAELKRIQTFADTYEFKGTKKEIIMQIGNAVPVRLAYHIAVHVQRTLALHLRNLTMPQLQQIAKERGLKGTWKLNKAALLGQLESGKMTST